MKLYAYSKTVAGIERRAQQRGLASATAEPPQQRRALAVSPVASNVVRFRRPPRAYIPLDIPSTAEVSKARHLAFLASANTKPAKPEDLIKRVAAWHDLCYRDIITDIRYRHFVEARNDCIAAVRIAYPEYTLEGLALTFSRTHVSILNALRHRGLA